MKWRHGVELQACIQLTINGIADFRWKASRYTFEGRIGQGYHAEAVLTVDKPSMAIGAAPLNCPFRLRRSGQRGF